MGELVTTPWDPADHLATEQDRAAYLEPALEKGDSALVAAALGCQRRSKSEPPCRPNIEPGAQASFSVAGCG